MVIVLFRRFVHWFLFNATNCIECTASCSIYTYTLSHAHLQTCPRQNTTYATTQQPVLNRQTLTNLLERDTETVTGLFFFSALVAAPPAEVAAVGYRTANKFRLMIIRYCLWFQTCWCVFGCSAVRGAATTATSFSLHLFRFCFPLPYYCFEIIIIIVIVTVAPQRYCSGAFRFAVVHIYL